jgi:hypothetical protein
MTEEDFMGLVDKVICGEITDAERESLRAYLKQNEDARRLYEETVETCELLGKVGDLEPPADLRKRIMDSVDATRYEVPSVGDSSLSGLKALFRPRLRLALAFSIGIVVGLLAYSMLRGVGQRPGDVSRLYGTIAGGEVGGMSIISSLGVDADGIAGEITLLETGDLLVVAPELAPVTELDVIIEFDPEQVRFEGFASPDGPGVTLTVEEGYVASHGAGDARYIISRIDTGMDPADLNIKVIKAGRVVYQGEFRLSKQR